MTLEPTYSIRIKRYTGEAARSRQLNAHALAMFLQLACSCCAAFFLSLKTS
jgi:hypothetical protein